MEQREIETSDQYHMKENRIEKTLGREGIREPNTIEENIQLFASVTVFFHKESETHREKAKATSDLIYKTC